MLLDLGVLLIAALLILLGIRGTYAQLWNHFFPGHAIVGGQASGNFGPAGGA